jgi:hypothetical protein
MSLSIVKVSQEMRKQTVKGCIAKNSVVKSYDELGRLEEQREEKEDIDEELETPSTRVALFARLRQAVDMAAGGSRNKGT